MKIKDDRSKLKIGDHNQSKESINANFFVQNYMQSMQPEKK